MTPSWRSWCWKLAGASALAMGGALAELSVGIVTSGNCALAQIVPDSTLGAESSVVTPNVDSDQIGGGAIRGINLFHSFREFNINEGRGAYFTNPAGIENILSRVTGGNPSNIFGKLGVLGNANLFLINPNGIIFGPNASLDVGGSFVGSTASSLKFADGSEFSATAPQTTPLLTINVPIGLQFGGVAGDISLNGPGLVVKPGKTLGLVGGDVTLAGGDLAASGGYNLEAPGGRIELGSVAGNSLVNLTSTDSGWNLGYGGVQNFQDIQLSQGAAVYAPTLEEGGGNIQVQARRLTTQDGAAIIASTLGSKPGGTLTVRASDSVELSGAITIGGKVYPGGLFTQVLEKGATGNGGNLTIETGRLLIRDGAQVTASTFGAGTAGNLIVRAEGSIELIGTTPNSEVLSGLFAQVERGATGNGGNLTIETGRLLIQDGAQASASTFGAGTPGNLTVIAPDSVELVGTSPNGQRPSGLFAQVWEGATGDGGDLTIETGRLTVLDGAQVSTAARNQGQGGELTINAADSILLSGISPIVADRFNGNVEDFRGSSGVFVSAEQGSTGNAGKLTITTGQLTVQDRAKISADTLGSGQGGNATLNVRQLIIRDGGQVRSGSFGEGPGATLTVNATDSVEVSGTGTIGPYPVNSSLFTAAGARSSGDAGDLNITTESLNVREGADVTVSSEGSGKAGELTVQARSIELDNNGSLIATTRSGNGGNIKLQLQDLLLLRRNSQISSTAGTAQAGGDGGNITINTPFIVAVPDENSDITANAYSGRGGKVEIKAQSVFGIEPRSRQELQTLLGTTNPSELDPSRLPSNDITAISQTNPELSGFVTFNVPDVDPTQGLVELPAELVDASNQIAQGCAAVGENKFIITGRGGMPPNPRQVLRSNAVQLDWVALDASAENRARGVESRGVREQRSSVNNGYNTVYVNPPQNEIVEAQGWVVDANGNVTLVATAPTATPYSSWQTPVDCREVGRLQPIPH